jgi:hypothetical protein
MFFSLIARNHILATIEKGPPDALEDEAKVTAMADISQLV